MDGDIRLVWLGKVRRGKRTVLGRFVTTVANVLGVLGAMGRSPGDFNELVVGSGVDGGMPVLTIVGAGCAEVCARLVNAGLGRRII